MFWKQKGETKEESKVIEYYREKIIEIIQKIEDVWLLEQIYRCIVSIVKEG